MDYFLEQNDFVGISFWIATAVTVSYTHLRAHET